MEAGVHVDVEPRGIFTTLIPTEVLLQPGPTPGAVPDAAMSTPTSAVNAHHPHDMSQMASRMVLTASPVGGQKLWRLG